MRSDLAKQREAERLQKEEDDKKHLDDLAKLKSVKTGFFFIFL